jgi:hypothetical protein
MLSQIMEGFEEISEAAVRLYVVTPTDNGETMKLGLENVAARVLSSTRGDMLAARD